MKEIVLQKMILDVQQQELVYVEFVCVMENRIAQIIQMKNIAVRIIISQQVATWLDRYC